MEGEGAKLGDQGFVKRGRFADCEIGTVRSWVSVDSADRDAGGLHGDWFCHRKRFSDEVFGSLLCWGLELGGKGRRLAARWLCQLGSKCGEVLNWVEAEKFFRTARDVGLEPEGLRGWSQKT